MCDTCSVHVPGPGEVAGGLLGLAAGAALTPAGRKVMFRVLALPFFLGIIWYTLGWWVVPIGLVLAVAGAGVARLARKSASRAVVQAPALTPQMAAKLAARGLKPIPGSVAPRPALPRAMRRRLAASRRALPAPQRALEGVVVPAPVPARATRERAGKIWLRHGERMPR